MFSVDYILCSGCQACKQACPTNAIFMQINNEGFWYPAVDDNKCIHCGICNKVCHYKNLKNSSPFYSSFAVINKNSEIRYNSTSGGVFFAFAQYIIENNGVVFGCAMTSDIKAVHSYSETINGCERYRGSKYVQSDVGNTYIKVKEFLGQGRQVLFTGTPCQINGLKTFLGRDYDNLLTIDVVCHGVPSPKVLEKYVKELENKLGEKIINIRFRDKANNWNNSVVVVIVVKSGKEIFCVNKDDKAYISLFLNNICLRKSCYHCVSNGIHRQSDISLADFWGVKNILPKMFDNMGTSLVLINTKKGKDVYDKISSNFITESVDFNQAKIYNPCIDSSSIENKKREVFFQNIDLYSLEKLNRKYNKKKLSKRFIYLPILVFKKILRKIRVN